MPIVVSAGYRRQNKFRGGIFSSRGGPVFGRELHERRGLRISGKERRETDERRTEHKRRTVPMPRKEAMKRQKRYQMSHDKNQSIK